MRVIRVLLIDDDQNYYTLTTQMLVHAEQSFKVDWVSNYQDGLNTMLRDQHDVYLIDYHLGQHSGYDLLLEATRKGVTRPIILMTGQGGQDIDVKSLQAGAADYVDKVQLKPEMLRRSIRYAVERGRYIQEMRESEDRYRSLIADAFEGILITDESGKILTVNTRITHITGYSDEELSLKSIKDLFPDIELDKKIDVNLSKQKLRHQNGKLVEVEMNAKRVSGSRLQFIIRDVANPTDTLEAHEQHIQKLTILNQVDEELSQILSIDSVLALALDATVRLSGADAGFIGLLDNNEIKLAQAIGHYTRIMPDDILPKTPIITEIINEPEARLIRNVEAEPGYIPADPRTKAHMILPMMSYERMVGIINLETSKPERFDEENFNFLKLIAARVAVAVENAQLYKISQDQLMQLQELYDQVSALEQIKTDMIRIAAHDLRNPVSVILGYTELLQKFNTNKDYSRFSNFLDMIERAASRMERITTDILSLERIENLQSDHADPVSLTEIVSDTFIEFENQAGNKSQAFTLVKVDENIHVRGDQAQLREAVANMMSNAIKYTPEKGSISISVQKEDDMVAFKVVDTGFGIQKEQQANLFQPFYRAHSKETTDIEGTGLGLYLIKNIVERYKGRIIFESEYGKGSTFGFKLPIA